MLYLRIDSDWYFQSLIFDVSVSTICNSHTELLRGLIKFAGSQAAHPRAVKGERQYCLRAETLVCGERPPSANLIGRDGRG